MLGLKQTVGTTAFAAAAAAASASAPEQRCDDSDSDDERDPLQKHIDQVLYGEDEDDKMEQLEPAAASTAAAAVACASLTDASSAEEWSAAAGMWTLSDSGNKKVNFDFRESIVERDEKHMRGVVGQCNRKTYLEMVMHGKPKLSALRQGPFDASADGERALKASLKRLKKIQEKTNEGWDGWVNRMFSTAHPEVVYMLLDAPFTESVDFPYMGVYINRSDIHLVTGRLWGACQVDGSWYGFTVAPQLAPQWLHEYILSARGQQLEGFVDGDTTNFSLGNVIGVRGDAEIVSPEMKITAVEEIKFEGKNGAKYPYGRWIIYYKEGGIKKSHGDKVRSLDLEEKNNSAERLTRNFLIPLKKQMELHAELDEAAKRSWKQKHPTARQQLPVDNAASPAVTRNTKWSSVVADGYYLGPWLRGRIVKHCQTLWELRWERVTADFKTREEAEAALLELNSKPPYSINRWMPYVDEFDIRQEIPTHGIRIMLTDVRYFIVSDDKAVLDALANHQWRDQDNNPGSNSIANFRAVNVDPSSEWQNARDLVAFTLLQNMPQWKSIAANSKGCPVIASVSDFRNNVYISPRCDPMDYRAHIIIFHFRKLGLQQLAENKKKNLKTTKQGKGFGELPECLDDTIGESFKIARSAARPGDPDICEMSPEQHREREQYKERQIILSDTRMKITRRWGDQLREEHKKVRAAQARGESYEAKLTAEDMVKNSNIDYGMFIQAIHDETVKREPETAAAAAAAAERSIPASEHTAPAWAHEGETEAVAAEAEAAASAMED